MSSQIFSATQLAVIAAVVLVIADVLGLFAAVEAFNEEQQSKADSRHEIEGEIKYLQNKLRSIK